MKDDWTTVFTGTQDGGSSIPASTDVVVSGDPISAEAQAAVCGRNSTCTDICQQVRHDFESRPRVARTRG
jgi:hypothetical protein